ncbi:hypothetical protein AS25_11470 [Kocuria marina]|uniref:DUF1345 domain-containing protein n=1 Tax=Kocuria marina TaxID=223184 RepID=A0A0B0DEI5_9MICC|nr:hypothetical protein AS25_11470 [Kocuria marina]
MDSWVQVVISLVVGIVVGAGVAWLVEPAWWVLLLASDVTVAVYLAWVWVLSWPADAHLTRQHAGREDPSRKAVSAGLVIAAVIGFAAAMLTIIGSSSGNYGTRALMIGLGAGSVVLSWLLVNTTYTLNYAHEYYNEPVGGLDFNQDDSPRYSDFAYVAFTIGMTFTVPDVTVQSSTLRRATLGHALLSFVFSTGLLAIVVSLIPSLAP